MAEALETRSIELVENSNDLLAIVAHELRNADRGDSWLG